MEYTAYGGLDSIDVSDLVAPAVIVGGVSATTVNGRLRNMFSAVPKSNTMGKLYFAGPIKVKKMSSVDEYKNARRIAKMGAYVSKHADEFDLTAIDQANNDIETGPDAPEWHGADEDMETNIKRTEPEEEVGLLDGF